MSATTQQQPNLIPYNVDIEESKGSVTRTKFKCLARNDEDAIGQAQEAHPDCEIFGWYPEVEDAPYLIYSPNEAAINDGAGFWSKEKGWVDEEEATRFTPRERIYADFMPLCTGQDAIWRLQPTAEVTAEIKVRYVLNGHSPESMRQRLHDELMVEVDRGILSGDTALGVDDYSVNVRIVEQSDDQDVDEDDIAAFITTRIEDGNLSLEDIPLLMARYGKMDPKQFITEMKERMAIDPEDED